MKKAIYNKPLNMEFLGWATLTCWAHSSSVKNSQEHSPHKYTLLDSEALLTWALFGTKFTAGPGSLANANKELINT